MGSVVRGRNDAEHRPPSRQSSWRRYLLRPAGATCNAMGCFPGAWRCPAPGYEPRLRWSRWRGACRTLVAADGEEFVTRQP